MNKQFTLKSSLSIALLLVCVFPVAGQTRNSNAKVRFPSESIEPYAGSWRTWAISSSRDFRAPAPPDLRSTRAELVEVRDALADRTPAIVDSISYWAAGAPAYRWMQLITNRILAGKPVTPYSHRLYTYVAMAMYDATVATWNSKYAYNRPRPAEFDSRLATQLPTPNSPSYPSEHAATAAAAAAVLSYFLPDEAADFQSMAEAAGKSQIYAGLQFPSDYVAGVELGRRVAERVIEVAKADGSATPWIGTVPTGPCLWIGTNPVNGAAATWKPFLLSAPSEFRPPAPAPCDSPEKLAELAIVRDFPRSPAAFTTNQLAMYWQSPEGLNFWPYVYADKWMFEDGLVNNAPRAARVYALVAISFFDSFIASQDGKLAYWYIRPSQLDPSITPIFPVPPHPSYPSNHSTFSATRSEMLAYLFPKHADEIRAVGKQAGDSRIWAGIHFPADNAAGVDLGKSVAGKFIAWASQDGSQ
ncbi:MAG TPA: vanadium-dependent haloperoxidase [Bryobacteraceae bacterium]|nr:vanadium-dependent haloperoxidase [Bryobacteraceae bacterium]